MKKFGRKLLRRKSHQDTTNLPAEQAALPRITNETVAAHREEVLSSARKYIYPLQHSKHKIVLVSTSLFVTALIAFFSYTLVALYKFQSTSTFLYRVTQVLPLPVGRTGSHYVSYENYLFELRRSIHYYQNQQKLDFTDSSGKQQLVDFKKRALEKVVTDAYVRQIAADHNISVSSREVEDQLTIEREQNRFGGTERQLEDTLKEFFGWSIDDFKRTLKQRLLEQKLVAVLDTDTPKRAATALTELKGGADFGAVAAKYSDDLATKDKGGDFGFAIDKNNRDVLPQTVAALFRLAPNQTSEVVNVGYSLEILKNLGMEGNKIRAAHILLNFKDITTYVNDRKETHPARLFIKL